MPSARQGKIARLPLAIREQVNQRLLDGESGGKILPWLNSLPIVVKILGEDFEGLAVNDNNLSDWRQGGYQDWLRRRDNIEKTRELAGFSVKLAKAGGGNLTEGAAAIFSGKILAVLEGIAGGEGLDPENVSALASALASLRSGDHSQKVIEQNERKLQQNQEKLEQGAAALKLAREKFSFNAVKAMFAQLDTLKAIKANTALDDDAKIQRAMEIVFGDSAAPAEVTP